MQESQSENNLLPFALTIWTWRKTILLVGILALVGSIVFSLLLKNYYQATTVFYAASEDVSKPNKIFSSEDVRYYGTNEDIERVITIGSSVPLMESMIDSFDLYAHYKINPDEPRAAYKVKQAFSKHYTLTKTKYNALELSFEDKDKALATRVANAARDKIDVLGRTMANKTHLNLVQSYDRSIQEKNTLIRQLDDSLFFLRDRYHIFDPATQGELLSSLVTSAEASYIKENAKLNSLLQQQAAGARIARDSIALLRASIAGHRTQLDSMTSVKGSSRLNINQFNLWRNKVEQLEDLLIKAKDQLNQIVLQRDQLSSSVEASPSILILVEPATIPLDKSRPKRTFLVLGTTAIAVILALMYVVLFERFKLIRQYFNHDS